MKLLPPKLVYKAYCKSRRSKIWKLIRRLQIVDKWRNLIKYRNLIKKARTSIQGCEHARNSALVIDGRCILIPGFRSDGVGIQAMLRICVMLLARQANAIYVHLPFLELAHQDIDYTGRSLTPKEWAAKWEAFFNFGKDEFHIANLANAMGEVTLAKHLSDKDRQFGYHGEARDKLPSFVEKIRGRNGEGSGIYTLNFLLNARSREYQLFLDAEFIQILQAKFETNGYKPEEMLYNEQYLDIAIHIRRGDVWDFYQVGSKEKAKHARRFVSEEYYVGLLQRLQKFFGSSSKPVRFHIFSDGRPENFGKFTFTGEREAFLKFKSGITIENIQFHLRLNSIDTLYHMIKAPIFVPGKSSFSIMAVLLSKSYVFYENEFRDYYQWNLLEKYMEGNPRFISLTRLEDRVDDVVEALSDSGLMD